MKEHRKIEQQVNEVMDSLDGMGRAKANPFLFTRVEAKLRQGGRSAWDTMTSYISRPAVALAMLCMVIFSNGVVMYWQAGPGDTPATSNDQPIALTEEYDLNVSSFYDDENPEP